MIEKPLQYLGIGTHGDQIHRDTGDDAQAHDTQKTLCVHLAVTGFQPDAALPEGTWSLKFFSATLISRGELVLLFI